MSQNNKATKSDKSSMEGMITNANHVLDKALNKGLCKGLFQKCIGVCILSAVEAGFVFSGQLGSGILLKKMEDGSWGAPCAMRIAGMGWGILLGGAAKEIIVFIFDKTSMEGIQGEAGIRIGGQVNLTLGPFGRNYEDGVGVSSKGVLHTRSVAFSKGAFYSLSLEGAFVGPKEGVNETFYGQATSAKGIVNGDIAMPEDKPTVINEVYKKLNKLQEPSAIEDDIDVDQASKQEPKTQSCPAEEMKEKMGKDGAYTSFHSSISQSINMSIPVA